MSAFLLERKIREALSTDVDSKFFVPGSTTIVLAKGEIWICLDLEGNQSALRLLQEILIQVGHECHKVTRAFDYTNQKFRFSHGDVQRVELTPGMEWDKAIPGVSFACMAR